MNGFLTYFTIKSLDFVLIQVIIQLAILKKKEATLSVILYYGIFCYEKKENLTDKIRTDQKIGSDFFSLCKTFGSR